MKPLTRLLDVAALVVCALVGELATGVGAVESKASPYAGVRPPAIGETDRRTANTIRKR